MSVQDNSQPARELVTLLRGGLSSYVLREFRNKYQNEDYLAKLQSALQRRRIQDEQRAKQLVDLQGWLNAIERRWKEVFAAKLGRASSLADENADVANARNFLYEIRTARNSFIAHETDGTEITDQDVHRLADTATRLLRVVDATEQAKRTEEIMLEFGRKIYCAEASNSNDEIGRVDLSGLDLSGQYLSDRNLHLADLRGANLTGSILRSINLAHQDLSHANLMRVDLNGIDLSKCNLSDANLSEARLDWANLQYAKFVRADLKLADLGDSKLDYADFSHADLTGANLSSAEERVRAPYIGYNWDDFDRLYAEVLCLGANFRNAILIQANMRRTLLELVDFRDANLTAADLIGARFSGNFAGAILRDADFSHCDLLSCNFTGAKMERVNFSNVSFCLHCIFSNADMSGANLANFFIDESNIDEEYRWHNANLSEAYLTGANLPRQSFRNANLTGAVFKNANLSYSDLSHADLMDTDFIGADLSEVNFDGAKFRYTTILPDGLYWSEEIDMTRFTGPPKE